MIGTIKSVLYQNNAYPSTKPFSIIYLVQTYIYIIIFLKFNKNHEFNKIYFYFKVSVHMYYETLWQGIKPSLCIHKKNPCFLFLRTIPFNDCLEPFTKLKSFSATRTKHLIVLSIWRKSAFCFTFVSFKPCCTCYV